MTDELDLDAIKARWVAVTRGPWWFVSKRHAGEQVMFVIAENDGYKVDVAMEPTNFYAYPSGAFIEPGGVQENLRAIAHAPADVAALVSEVDRLRSHVATLETMLGAVTADRDDWRAECRRVAEDARVGAAIARLLEADSQARLKIQRHHGTYYVKSAGDWVVAGPLADALELLVKRQAAQVAEEASSG